MTDTPKAAAPKRRSLRERLGWRAERRPEPGFAHVLAAGVGAFAVFATVAVVVEIDGDDAHGAGVLLSLALAAARSWWRRTVARRAGQERGDGRDRAERPARVVLRLLRRR